MIRFLRQRVFTFTFGLLLTASLLGSALLQSAAAGEMRFGQGLLWKVEKDGGPASYVLGTIHSTDPRLRDLPPEIREAFDASSDMAFEFVGSPDQRQKMAEAMRLPPGQRLEDILGPELFERCVVALEPLGIQPEGLQGFKPWALSVFMVFPPLELARQAQGQPAFDFWLQAEAQRAGKRLHSLESIEDQIALFDEMGQAEQVAMVSDMVADYEEIDQKFNTMFRAYLKGNIAAIIAVANDYSGVSDPAAADSLKERLLDDRNHEMVRSMQPLLSKGGAFVAIGAAHLPDEAGILALLEAQGFRVSRVY